LGWGRHKYTRHAKAPAKRRMLGGQVELIHFFVDAE